MPQRRSPSANRPARTRILLSLLLLIAAYLSSIAWAVPPLPPAPPEGWELHVTPGFTPPIEAVLVEPGKHREKAELWRNWGPDAIPVLLKLHNDERWRDFQQEIQFLLYEADAPELRPHVLEEIRKRESGTSETEARLRQGLLLNVSDWPETQRYINERLATLLAAPSRTAAEVNEATLFIGILAGRDQAFFEMLPSMAEHAPSDLLPAYANAATLYGKEVQSHAILQEMAKSDRPEIRDAAEKALKSFLPRYRPLEPLDNVPPAPFNEGKGEKTKGISAKHMRRKIIEHETDGTPHDAQNDYLQQYTAALGDKAIPLLEEVATDPRHAPMRYQAVMSLAGLGTKKSTQAFLRLRDKWRESSPIKREGERRHIDSMYESAAFVMQFSPGSSAPQPRAPEPTFARIDDNYRSGTAAYGPAVVEMKRFGREWIPIEISITVP